MGAGRQQATKSFSTQGTTKEAAVFVAAFDTIKAKMATNKQSELSEEDQNWYNKYAKTFIDLDETQRKTIADNVGKKPNQINIRDMVLSDAGVVTKRDSEGKAKELKDFEAKVLTEKDKLDPPKAEDKPPLATPPSATPTAPATPPSATPTAPQAEGQSQSSNSGAPPSLVSPTPSSGLDITLGSQAIEQGQEEPQANSFDTINADQQVTVSSPPAITTIPNILGDRTKFRKFELFEPTDVLIW